MNDYAKQLKDPRWQKKRLEVMNRDGFTCRDCGSAKDTLHVHHCGYRGKSPWDAPSEILITVCDPCHKNRQLLEKEARQTLEEWFAKSTPNDIATVCVRSSEAADWEASIRWFMYASDHPEHRKAFEEVTGFRPNWDKITAKRAI